MKNINRRHQPGDGGEMALAKMAKMAKIGGVGDRAGMGAAKRHASSIGGVKKIRRQAALKISKKS